MSLGCAEDLAGNVSNCAGICQQLSDDAQCHEGSCRATFGTGAGNAQLLAIEPCIFRKRCVVRWENFVCFVVADIPAETGTTSDQVLNGAVGPSNLLSRSTHPVIATNRRPAAIWGGFSYQTPSKHGASFVHSLIAVAPSPGPVLFLAIRLRLRLPLCKSHFPLSLSA